MSSHTITETQVLKTETCASCGVVFAMPEHLMAKLRQERRSFYCPNGHCLTYGGGRVEELQDELAATKRELEGKQVELTAARCATLNAQEAKARVEKELKRHKTRTRGGVCPCCNRSFVALSRHIAHMHPNFKP